MTEPSDDLGTAIAAMFSKARWALGDELIRGEGILTRRERKDINFQIKEIHKIEFRFLYAAGLASRWDHENSEAAA